MTDVNQQKAIFISVGTKLSLKTATELCLKMLVHEIPEPVRFCDRNSRKMIKKMEKKDYEKAPSYDMVFIGKGEKKEE